MSADARIAVLASQATTNQEGRALLGVAADYIRQGYEAIPKIANDGVFWFWEGIYDQATGIRGAQDAARNLLDVSNAYAQGLYAVLPDDDAALDATMRARIEVALGNAYTDLAVVDSVVTDIQSSFLDALEQAASIFVKVIASAGAEALKLAGAAAVDHLGVVVVLVGLIAGYLFLRRKLAP